MYEKHPVFQEPPSDTTIWRYMSFSKLVSMLQTRSLYFRRVDKLREDTYEGRLPRPTFDIMDEHLRRGYENMRLDTIINCWCMSEHESVALWKTYVPHNEGVAIKSEYRRLKECFNKEGLFKEATVHLGIVRYIDFNKDDFIDKTNTAFNGFIPLLHKRQFFEYERELRAVISGLGTHFLHGIIQKDPGLRVPVSIDNLLVAIHIAPQAETWFGETVKCVVESYGLNPNIVVQSSLDEPLGRE